MSDVLIRAFEVYAGLGGLLILAILFFWDDPFLRSLPWHRQLLTAVAGWLLWPLLLLFTIRGYLEGRGK